MAIEPILMSIKPNGFLERPKIMQRLTTIRSYITPLDSMSEITTRCGCAFDGVPVMDSAYSYTPDRPSTKTLPLDGVWSG
jgi:hypothetical protein